LSVEAIFGHRPIRGWSCWLLLKERKNQLFQLLYMATLFLCYMPDCTAVVEYPWHAGAWSVWTKTWTWSQSQSVIDNSSIRGDRLSAVVNLPQKIYLLIE